MKNPKKINLRTALYEKASSYPDAVAVLAPGRPPLDYAGVKKQVEYCASQLAAMGLTQRSRVAVVLPNGAEMATCCLGVAAYACCAPLNPGYRKREFLYYLEDLKAEALVLSEGKASEAREAALELGIPIVDITVVADSPAGRFSFCLEKPVSDIRSDNESDQETALILHTSGTTSKPKIVPLTHANLYSSASNIISTLRLGQGDRCLNVMPLFHIHGFVATLLAPLLSGGSVVCTAGFDEIQFFKWIAEFKPTWYTAVPTVHQAVLQNSEAYRSEVSGHQFRFIRSSSTSLPPSSLAELETLFSAPVVEAYGMTEGSHQIAINPLPPEQRKPGSVGRPVGTEISIMDGEGNVLGRGETGEIVIRGENVTSGYENQAREHSFFSGWLRTGDQGWFDEDGYLFITGRLKEIVNRGGEKVSPREVDEALLNHPSVAQAVAFGVPHPTLGEDLNAAVVLKKGQRVTGQMLRDFAFQSLAAYKVPSKIIVVDALPKSATGKIQRLTLAEKLAPQIDTHYVAPETSVQRALSRIFAEVLGLDRVGIHDNFFSLGGDSLRGTQAIVRINTEFDLELPGPTLYHLPTIEEMASHVERVQKVRDEQIERLAKEIESLSDEEVAALLEEA